MTFSKRSALYLSFAIFLLVPSLAVFGQTSLSPVPYQAFCSDDNDTCMGDIVITLGVQTSCPLGIDDFLLYQIISDSTGSDTIPISGSPWTLVETDTVIIQTAFEIGTHLLHFVVMDSCGESTNVNLPIEVVDCQPPIFTCAPPFPIELLPINPPADVDGNGTIDQVAMGLWARDAIQEQTVYDCSGQEISTNDPDRREVTEFNIYRRAELDTLIPAPGGHEGIVFAGCEAVGIHELIVYAWDDADNPYAVQPDGSIGGANWDSCGLVVHVVENFGICELPHPWLTGLITSEEDDLIAGVKVVLAGNFATEVTTAGNGEYFIGLPSYSGDYTVIPEFNENHKNGVSTFDLVLIAKHILGIDPLDSPYKMIAADANNSGSITTLDLIKIRRLVLDIDEVFDNNTSWRFVARDFVFPDPADPWETVFPELINLQVASQPALALDFIGIKVGDVNGSANYEEL